MPFRDVSPGAMGMAELAAAPINAFYGARDDAVRNKLNTLRVQQVQNELDDDAEWDAAYARKDWDTLRRLDPEATELLVAHERQKAMSGLEDISISRQKIDMAPLIRREDDQWNQVRDQRNEDRRYRLDLAREARMNAPQPSTDKPQLVDVSLPDGTVQKQWVVPGRSAGTPVGSPVAAPAKATSQQAYTMYRAAMDGLEGAMGSAVTGPVIGRLPAFFSDAQTADGAVAAMAPILKQLFRTAGEGTFTDKDQQLLLAMVPTRADRPKARANKIRNIDGIVRAKLGVDPPPSAPTAGPKSYKTKGGATVEILE